ncbi:pregnancy zone protein, partial [Nephila pilipes]
MKNIKIILYVVNEISESRTKMELKNTFRLIIVFQILFLANATQQDKDKGYIFTSPRTLKIGSYNQLQLLRFGCLDNGYMKVQLFYTKDYNGNETLLQEVDYQLEKGKKDSFFTFFVNPFGDDNAYDGRLQINGTLCGNPFSGTDRILFSNSNGNIILIQTDKALYKPGQN